MESQEKKGWLNRNWRWFIPVAGVSFILLLAAFAGTIVLFVIGSIKSTDVYQEAVIKAKADSTVLRELGEPVQTGWLVSGSIKINPDSGHADIKIPISGPKNSGTIHAV
ncbi:MAG TPA: cytochrome c oxidase assembly factor Coa1 family protein, partial [Blastocatellia bacterium]|nr:cytochrome c oxidase assembly factor Coa1 family protein [Blastocatellia bacterium]